MKMTLMIKQAYVWAKIYEHIDMKGAGRFPLCHYNVAKNDGAAFGFVSFILLYFIYFM